MVTTMWRVGLVAVIVSALLPRPVDAWSFELHREITSRAITLLPPELQPFFEARREFVVERSVDPDLWRTAGFTEEPPRHFLDLDAYGEYPFSELPRDFDEAVAKFGREKVTKYGTVPWRATEIWDSLVKAFAEAGERGSPLAADRVAFFSAIVAHYVSDANVPFHAVLNYDGQLTNQHGVHARFESELYRRYGSRVKVTPQPIPPVASPRDHVFDRLLESARLVEPVLAADLAAIGEGEVYDDAYFERFFDSTHGILEQRLASSVASVAALITGAWEAAGRPDMSREFAWPVQRRRQVQ